MNRDDVKFLTSPAGSSLLAELGTKTPADPLKMVSSLRAQGFTPDQVSAALGQAALRTRAITKFGPDAERLFFTEAGLEQATRRVVADYHAARYVAAGLTHVADLGCGIGANSLAFQRAGLRVTAVELDPLTAELAALNLGAGVNREADTDTQTNTAVTALPAATVICSDAETAASGSSLGDVDSYFLDPARRTSGHSNTQRITDPNDYSPSLTFAFGLAEKRPTGIKLGPGQGRDLIPENAEAQWVSVGGQVVEMGLWFGELARAGIRRSALLMSADGHTSHELSAPEDSEDVDARTLGEYIYEPDGAVIRARLIGLLADRLGAGMLSQGIAYLTSDSLEQTPFAQKFRVREVLPFHERTLKQAMREREIGTLEIKKRGADVDPAVLRKKLQLKGPNHATLIITRVTDAGTAGSSSTDKRVAILADRV